jgi:hypothetical protein
VAQRVGRRSFSRIIKKIRRQEATTGRQLSRSSLRALFEAEIGVAQSRQAESAEFEFRKEQEATRSREAEELAEGARRGAILKGGVNIALAGKELAETETGGRVLGKLSDVGKRIIGARTTTAATTALPGGAAGALIPAAATTLPGGVAGALAPAAAPVIGTGIRAAGKTIGKAAIPAAIGGFVGSKISEAIGGEGKGARTTGRIVGGAATGFAFAGPPGAAVGAVLGVVGAETVICTELYRQGYLSSEVYALDDHILHKDIDEDIYNGYMRWAPYVVKAMQKSWLVTQLVRPFAVGWATHMAHRLDKNIPDSFLGKIVYKIGVPICKRIGLRRRVRQWLSSQIS